MTIVRIGNGHLHLYKPSEMKHPSPSRLDPGQWEKINLNFYFHTSLWCFKTFYKVLKAFIKLSVTPQRSGKFTLIFIFIRFSEMHGAGRANKTIKRTALGEVWRGACNWLRKVLALQISMQSCNIYKIGVFLECSPESGYVSFDAYSALNWLITLLLLALVIERFNLH